MGRLFDEKELEKYIMHDGCEKGCGYIDERDLKYIQPVEAIPKADYEARLKADLEAVLKEIQTQAEENIENIYEKDVDNILMLSQHNAFADCFEQFNDLIQEKINSLKGEV